MSSCGIHVLTIIHMRCIIAHRLRIVSKGVWMSSHNCYIWDAFPLKVLYSHVSFVLKGRLWMMMMMVVLVVSKKWATRHVEPRRIFQEEEWKGSCYATCF